MLAARLASPVRQAQRPTSIRAASGKEKPSAKPPEAAAAALAASVAFFRRPRSAVAPRRRGLLLLLRDTLPQLALALLSFVLANALPRPLPAVLLALTVFTTSLPRRREVMQLEEPPENTGNDVAEVSLLNTAVQEMWPEITSFIRTVLKDTVEEAIRTRMPWFLSSLGFGRISFGDSALKVEQLEVERLIQGFSEGDVRSFKVSSLVAWDADVDVALTAPGAALSAEHVLVKGRLDVCLQQILPRPPFFTAITFYFAELPKVLITLDGTVVGLRVSLQWLEKTLADIIQRQLAEQIVLPRVAAVLLDITNDDAWFEAGNMFPEGVCTVVVHNAADLAAKDMALPFGLSQPSSDPYCEISLGGKSWRTPTRPQNLNPVWTEEEGRHGFLVHSQSEQQLVLHFYDENPYLEDVSLGYASLPVADLSRKALPRTMALSEQGRVSFTATWSELKLEESNLRRQLQSLDAAGRPSFVVLVGIDCCDFPEPPPPRGYVCKVTCEAHEETYKSRTARKRGRYGASAWWRPRPEGASQEVEEPEEDKAAHFQATFTHMIQGDPRSTICHIKIEKRRPLPVGKDVGEVDFPVYRLISAAANSAKVVLPLGMAKLHVLAQLRSTS